MEIARTPATLFRQMRAQGRPDDELELVRHCCDFATPLHSARFEVDGTPFHVHGLGVASVVAHLGAPAELVGAALIHNCYVTGDWGDGRDRGPFPSRRARLREQLGAGVEEWVTGLYEGRRRGLLDVAASDPDKLSERDRWLVLLDLGDLLDKWDDGRVMYSVDGRLDRGFVEGREDLVVGLAEGVGAPELAAAFSAAFARVAGEQIPEGLRLGRRYSDIVPPPSYRRRRSVVVRGRARRYVQRARRTLRRPRRSNADRPVPE